MHIPRASALLYLFISIQLSAHPADGDSAKGKWDVTAKHGPASDVEFETDEGTWISVDVSPDANKVVFDLLGDIYLMPISGGSATLLAGGPAYESQPRFNPKGDKISFTSD